MKFILAFVALFAASEAASIFEIVNDEWALFKLQYNKTYSTDMEEGFRMKVYLKNKRKIAKHNSKFEKGLVTFTMGLNHLSDMFPQEIALLNGYRRFNSTVGSPGISFIEPAHIQLAEHVDWRTKGVVTSVKDQGECGSCWAFSTTGALEGQHFRRTGKLVSLSEQNLVDCSTAYGNKGCSGGMPDSAFQYVQENRGIDTEASYPYEGKDEPCHFKQNSVGATDRGFVDIPTGDEVQLRSAVGTVGPVSVAIDASHESFHHYNGGIYFEPECKSTPDGLDHAVLVVGYGSEDGVDYWLVKNSWGPRWGEKGYVRMARNQGNNCGIATDASFPLV